MDKVVREAAVQAAIADVGKGMSVNAAAKRNGVPTSTLQSRLKQADPTKVRRVNLIFVEVVSFVVVVVVAALLLCRTLRLSGHGRVECWLVNSVSRHACAATLVVGWCVWWGGEAQNEKELIKRMILLGQNRQKQGAVLY